jgi:UDP-N-acetylglucosamine pyrophosphorylase
MPSNLNNLAVVILAAGKGTRMKDPSKAKVMYELLGKPMVHYVIELSTELKANRILVVVGYGKEYVTRNLLESGFSVECIVQEEQLGTGHAVMQTEEVLRGFNGSVLVLSGDVPLLTSDTLSRLQIHHAETEAIATILTAELDDPTGYGRIIRNEDGSVKKIVEQKDASPDELAVKEINSGIYVFQKEALFDGLKNINSHNAQNEYYLTDVFEYFWRHELKVSAIRASDPNEIRGINTVAQLDEAKRLLEERLGRMNQR